MKARKGIGSFFLVAGIGFVVVGVAVVALGGAAGVIAGGTYGALTDSEFAVQKAKVLSGQDV